MEKWQEVLVESSTPIIEVMRLIDETTMQFAAVVDSDCILLGSVTDGDIRRGILKGIPLDRPIAEVMNRTPIHLMAGKSDVYYRKQMEQLKIKQLPIISEDYKLVEILFAEEPRRLLSKENLVVLMAGGLGTRLRPLTESIPKPMLNVGSKPILETIIESFKSYGFTRFILSVNYKKEVIKDYFQDGSHLGVSIDYIEETKRLGTAGGLSLLPEYPKAPFFVMNGDLLTKINFEQLLNFHVETNSSATMCVREYEYQIPYGVVETKDEKLLSIQEKPINKSFVNTGVYVLNPKILDEIPANNFFDMPDLFKSVMESNQSVSAFPLREYWLDIGQMDDYKLANETYWERFHDK
ncbi:nucleotidyltransferase family protein [Sporosarcina gallistercoris]|uniref:Nucleotidyltransferase family protein n=1 Tax=Sporosarcina gallistercoris TaxID=2762245 RepID=A0ABR8PN63_9BACL|nr:nucleotidyltransferase family protein [Sporosarcina gallistercoris]MBD7909618.1 nucleotidyltransferase family protein [Sporosarcina gallistercoris]